MISKTETAVGASFLVIIAAFVIIGGSWGVNIYKLCKSDFDPIGKREIVHAVGVFIPPVSLVTCWLTIEE